MESELPLQIILLKPPADVVFGLQKGSGSIYETVQKQQSTSKDLSFQFSITIKGDQKKDALPKFSGPYVHGPAGGKFIYIDIGQAAGQHGTEWSRRLKIPLTGITWEIIDHLTSNPESILITRVPGTGKDGGPNCATVKPFEGWKRIKSGV
jgi:hypothetical protein